MVRKAWIFSDGACSGNPGPGGWGFILVTNYPQVDSKVSDKWIREVGGREAWATNNQMELRAVIESLKSSELTYAESIIIYSDSRYVVQGITQWVYGWKQRNWLKSDGQPVVNPKLWGELLDSAKLYGKKLSWKLIAGHQGILGNHRADQIAVNFSKNRDLKLYEGPSSSYPEDWVQQLDSLK